MLWVQQQHTYLDHSAAAADLKPENNFWKWQLSRIERMDVKQLEWIPVNRVTG
jgi:hypothetical protein